MYRRRTREFEHRWPEQIERRSALQNSGGLANLSPAKNAPFPVEQYQDFIDTYPVDVPPTYLATWGQGKAFQQDPFRTHNPGGGDRCQSTPYDLSSSDQGQAVLQNPYWTLHPNMTGVAGRHRSSAFTTHHGPGLWAVGGGSDGSH